MFGVEKQNFSENEKEIIDNSKDQQDKLSKEKLQSISNREFLSIQSDNRLQYITKRNITSNDLVKKDLRIKNLEFSFTFNGKFNKELYLKTTAGQVFPEKISKVTSGSIEYERKGISGEFFSTEGRRLLIHEGTQIEIGEIRKEEELQNIKDINSKKIEEFEKNKNYKIGFIDLVSEAIRRGIDPSFALLAFSSKIKDLSIISSKRQIVIEELFTQYDRERDSISMVEKNRDDFSKLSVLSRYNSDWKEKAVELGINSDIVKSYSSLELSGDLEEKTVQFIKGLEGFTKVSKWDVKQSSWGFGTKANGNGIAISKSEAEQELKTRIKNDYYPVVSKYVSLNPLLGDNQKIALTSFVFNLGSGILSKNGWGKLILGYPSTANEIVEKMRLYNKAEDGNGNLVVSDGLVNRRNKEIDLFLKS